MTRSADVHKPSKEERGQLLDSKSFDAIAALAYAECGLTLPREKISMVQSRLRRRLQSTGVSDFADYVSLLNAANGAAERRFLISALTTNVSHFFREKHHFDALESHLRDRSNEIAKGRDYRIWSAGCSNGQEPLSAAMTCAKTIEKADTRNLKILATDIDPAVVEFARAGQYPEGWTHGIDTDDKAGFFRRKASLQGEAVYETAANLRQLIHFKELNLLGKWPMARQFDVIFCRNVVIYFDHRTQEALWPRFHAALKPDGLLFLGHSERISDPGRFAFEVAGPTSYRPIPKHTH